MASVAGASHLEVAATAERHLYKDLTVSNFSSQQTWARKPFSGHVDEAAPAGHIQETQDGGLEVPNSSSGENPSVATWRSNCIALSHTHNLYFAAIEDKIHITVPRTLKQIVPGKPDLILRLPRSEAARCVGGYIDPSLPHCVNNMLVGNLGTQEILLVCCDDGDVLAYYTHYFDWAITSKDFFRPLLHENVGKSAWGLAIHEKSRLIAISSNLKEVTLFAFRTNTSEPWEPGYQDSYPCVSVEAFDAKRSFQNCRVIFSLDEDNIPSICFVTNVNTGEAESIMAIDIRGTIWVLELTPGPEPPRKIPSTHKPRGNILQPSHMGWGVLPLPLSMCLHTPTPHEAMGISDGIKHYISVRSTRDINEAIFDISRTVRHVRNACVSHPVVLGTQPRRQSKAKAEVSVLIPDNSDSSPRVRLKTKWPVCRRRTPNDAFNIDTGEMIGEGRVMAQLEAYRLARRRNLQRPRGLNGVFGSTESVDSELSKDMIIFQSMVNDLTRSLMGSITTTFILLSLLDDYVNKAPISGAKLPYKIAPEDIFPCAILRIYQSDIELIPLTAGVPRTICRSVVRQTLSQDLSPFLGPFDRLIFSALIPELSLVVVASQSGRVALLTVTRPDDRFSRVGPVVTFRIDAILPTKEHEDEGHRPTSPLLGMAVAPIQTGVPDPSRSRWRVLLHYYNATILSYELYRGGSDVLLVL
ncbi:hypothetical protein BJ878DRAFT_487815 [Calycina marina]|uniref:Uncharacterized protein n=1 Tax=Calycina marina TaxID=1763456 RepID=A0A9P7ZAE7_9HELO|nr:hypothetical protein BJ878DRAFT_487815 [Calycina marina]